MLRWQSDDCKGISSAYGDGFRYAALPGGGLMILHGTPWCSSHWSGFGVDVVAPANDATPQRKLHHAADGYAIDDDSIRPKVRLDGDTVHRVQPAAVNSRDFVDEWLIVDDMLAREWIDPASVDATMKARKTLNARRNAIGVSIADRPVRACSVEKDRYQVEIELTAQSAAGNAKATGCAGRSATGTLRDAPGTSCRELNLMSH